MNTTSDITSSDFIFNGEVDDSWAFSDHKEIANRGFNVLFSVTHKGNRYLLKGLKPEYRKSATYQLQLLKEYRLGKTLKHEHICHTFSMVEDALAGQCMVIEYIDGCNLKEWLATNRSSRLRHKVFCEILAALDYCHAKQVIHRDIKPSNIMVARNGNVAKLIDFGLADNDSYIVLKQTGGTQGYMAPEQAEAGHLTDASTDIYALGCLMGELFPHRYWLLRWHCKRRNPKHRPQHVAAVKRRYMFWRWLPWLVVGCGLMALGWWLMPKQEPTTTVVTTEVVVHDTVPIEVESPMSEVTDAADVTDYDGISQMLYYSLEEVYRTEIDHCMGNESYTFDIESELRRRSSIVVNNMIKTAPAQYHNLIQKDAASFSGRLNEAYREQLYECRLLSVKRNRQ